jgi:hydroxypyruvate isomerase
MLRFAANLSMLWRELRFTERFGRAGAAGFKAVEFQWPRGENLDEIVAARKAAGVEVVLHNMDAGDMARGDRGFANDPGRRSEWRECFLEALGLAARLECPRLNCLVGNRLPDIPVEAQVETVLDNLAWALPRAAAAGVTIMLEALNPWESPRYLLTRTADSFSLIQRLGFPPNLKIQYDVYHIQRSEGNLVATLRGYLPWVGHIQVADSPERHQPGTGEINWKRVFSTLEELGYQGYIGLEYNPPGPTEESFGWLPAEKRSAASVADLNL